MEEGVAKFAGFGEKLSSEIEAFKQAAQLICELVDHGNIKTWTILYYLHAKPKDPQSQLLSALKSTHIGDVFDYESRSDCECEPETEAENMEEDATLSKLMCSQISFGASSSSS